MTSESYTPDVFSNQLDAIAIGGTPNRTLTHSASGQIAADDRDGVAYGYDYDKSNYGDSLLNPHLSNYPTRQR